MPAKTRFATEFETPEFAAKSFFESDFTIANRIAFFQSAFGAFRDFDNDFTFALDPTTFFFKLAFRVDDKFDSRFSIFGICQLREGDFAFPTIQFVGENFGAEGDKVIAGFQEAFNRFA